MESHAGYGKSSYIPVELRTLNGRFSGQYSWSRTRRALIGAHADQRLRERRVVGWQVVDGMEMGRLIRERPDASPNPIAEFDITLADGTPLKVIWSWIAASRIAKLVKVHFFDR
jgi:hypothetical protein